MNAPRVKDGIYLQN